MASQQVGFRWMFFWGTVTQFCCLWLLEWAFERSPFNACCQPRGFLPLTKCVKSPTSKSTFLEWLTTGEGLFSRFFKRPTCRLDVKTAGLLLQPGVSVGPTSALVMCETRQGLLHGDALVRRSSFFLLRLGFPFGRRGRR